MNNLLFKNNNYNPSPHTFSRYIDFSMNTTHSKTLGNCILYKPNAYAFTSILSMHQSVLQPLPMVYPGKLNLLD